jgi:hypothetical protein
MVTSDLDPILQEEKRRMEEQMAKKQRYLGNLHQQVGLTTNPLKSFDIHRP